MGDIHADLRREPGGILVGEVDINDQTRIGLYTVLASVPLFVAAIFFLALIFYKAEAAEHRLEQHEKFIDEQRSMLIEIRERTARIEAILERMSHK